jgi:Domain of unknown function (DUF6950)
MRVEGWEQMLFEAVEEARGKEYVLGKHDCALFAIDLLSKITGVDYGAKVRGKYKTLTGAKGLIKRLGKGTNKQLGKAVSAVLMLQPSSALRGHRGDPLLITLDKVEHIGICVGSEGVVLAPEGLLFIPLNQFQMCWNT